MTERVRPRALRQGDVLGVCSPSGPVDERRLERGLAELESMGFRTKVTPSVRARRWFTAGTVEQRRRDLYGLFADEEVAGIVCTRGGAGADWLLPGLDQDLLRRNPKVFVGYSDLTFLHTVLTNLGLVAFHGPMVARDMADGGFDRPAFLAAVTGEGAPYASEPDDLLVLREGDAEGTLLGGCLSMLSAAAGTPWALRPDPEGTILFIEDVDEPPYKIDRMLFELRHSGAFEGLRGIVFGDMRGCSPGMEASFTLDEVLLEALDGLNLPVALGLSSGHSSGPNVTLPLGIRARLTCAGEARFQVLEPAVS